MICAFGIVLFVCEVGQRISDTFDIFDDTIEKFDWYSFPIEINQILLMIIMMAQQPVELECFGSFSANRGTLKKVSIPLNIHFVYVILDISILENFLFFH